MIRRATQQDIQAIADIDRISFSGNRPPGAAEKWVTINFARGEQYQYFVFEQDGKIAGYIAWEMKHGWAREIPIIELERLGVDPSFRGHGIGKQLVEETFLIMKEWIHEQRPEAKEMRVIAWTRNENEKSLSLYKHICNDGITGQRSLVSTDEVLLRGTYQF